ncbi:MAG: patatin-like phospholipase family protein [Bacteroidota bacterium]
MFCKYRILLSIDGAGIKGVIPLKILNYLHQSMIQLDDELDVTSWVDVFSSCSASSIFTGALMLKDKQGRTIHSPGQMLDFYLKRGPQIFSHNVGVSAEDSIYPLTFTLNHFFGQINMMDVRNHFLFLSYSKTQESLFSFSNFMERYYDLSLAKVMNACSAIPGVYPSVRLGNLELCDALFKMQNPSLMAYDYAKMLYPNEHLILISIGAGETNELTPLSLQVRETHQRLLEISEDDQKLTYFRFQPKLKTNYDAADISRENMEELVELSEAYIFNEMHVFEELLHLMAFKAV